VNVTLPAFMLVGTATFHSVKTMVGGPAAVDGVGAAAVMDDDGAADVDPAWAGLGEIRIQINESRMTLSHAPMNVRTRSIEDPLRKAGARPTRG